jgi:hypothetical protein
MSYVSTCTVLVIWSCGFCVNYLRVNAFNLLNFGAFKVKSEQIIGDAGRKKRWALSLRNFMQRLRKTTKAISENSLTRSGYLNWGSLEY